jgi:hypothetical protein
MMKGVTVAYTFILAAYVVSGASGYYAFGATVGSDVLMTLSQYIETGAQKAAIAAAQACG